MNEGVLELDGPDGHWGHPKTVFLVERLKNPFGPGEMRLVLDEKLCLVDVDASNNLVEMTLGVVVMVTPKMTVRLSHNTVALGKSVSDEEALRWFSTYGPLLSKIYSTFLAEALVTRSEALVKG